MTDQADVPEITVKELAERLENGDAPTLLDVREHFERRVADLPDHGQLRIPTGELLHRMGELNADDEVVVYCRTGSRSAWATRLLQERGFERVLNLKGGLMAWREEIDPSLRAY